MLICIRAQSLIKIWAATWDFQQCGMCDQQRLRPACAYAQSDLSLCWSLGYSMTVKLLTEHQLEFLSLKGSCRGLSESTLVKMPHCWKSHVTAHISCRSRVWAFALTANGLKDGWIHSVNIVYTCRSFNRRISKTLSHSLSKCFFLCASRVRGYKTSFMLNWHEHKICSGHTFQNASILAFWILLHEIMALSAFLSKNIA